MKTLCSVCVVLLFGCDPLSATGRVEYACGPEIDGGVESDAEVTDAPVPEDAGEPDAYVADAGSDAGSVDAGPPRIELIFAGQSNAMATSSQVPRAVPRADILAAHDVGSGTNRELVAWGPMGPTRPSGWRGLEVTIPTGLHDTYGLPVHMMLTAIAGAPFGRAGESYRQWAPPSRYVGPEAYGFQRLAALVTSTRAAHPEATVADRTWLIWTHGESDCGDAVRAADYLANLTAFVSDFRSLVGPADTRVAIVRIPSNLANRTQANIATVRAAQATFVANDPLAVLVDSDGFTLNADGAHWTGTMHEGVAARLVPHILGNL